MNTNLRDLFLQNDVILYKNMKNANLVSTQYDFSKFLGCSPSLYSTLKAKKMPISSRLLLGLSIRLGKMLESVQSAESYGLLLSLRQDVESLAKSRAVFR